MEDDDVGASAAARLAAADALIARAREARGAFEHLRGRLWRVLERSGGAASPLLGDTLRAFCELLERQDGRRLVLQRIGSIRRVAAELRGLHAAVDELEAGEADAEDWDAQVRASVDAQLASLAAALGNRRLMTDETKASAKEDALAALRCEVQHHAQEQPGRALELMEQALEWAKRALGAAAVPAEVPPWFIPSDEVKYSPSGFDMGSFGSVHLGTWHGGQRVVVKKLLAADADARASFLKEADVWWALEHEHVVRLFGACHTSSFPLFVCEEAPRGNFATYFEPERATQHELWRLLLEAARGLQYLHEKKVVHGDLKCNNLLVSGDGRAKICDFGFAYIRRESIGLSAKPQADSVRWKAPECLLGQDETALTPEKNPRFASDVYSLGLCIIEAFANEPPYGFQDDLSIVEMVLDGELPERPWAMLDDRAWELVTHMCAREWTARPSIAQVADRIKVFADEEAVEPGRHYRRQPEFSREEEDKWAALDPLNWP